MSEYRDYGILGSGSPAAVPVDTVKYGQVYQATHSGNNNRLSYMQRSFISFTFDGRPIEDFNLIATFSNNRLNRNGYADFKDNTSTYDNLDGQYYWNTHYTTNSLEFTLSTDGINQRELDDFLAWFQAGKTKELILAEHPNRAILARVSTPPVLNLLPFEQKTEITISKFTYPTSTTLYKGDITLKFVMDSPYWYSKVNILGKKEGNVYVNTWHDVATNSDVSIFSSQDALKVLLEDGIPLGSNIQNNMLLGDGTFASVEDQIESKIWNPNSTIQSPNTDSLTGGGACIDGTKDGVTYKGVISGAIVDVSGNGIESLAGGNYGYFYYSGNAPAYTLITFTMTPIIENGYITHPFNSYCSNTKFNTFTIQSTSTQKLCFTTPNLFTSFNKAVDIFKNNIDGNHSWESIREKIRDDVRHKYIREWAIKIIDSYTQSSMPSSGSLNDILTKMSYVLKDSNGNLKSVTFSFNSETGEAVGLLHYRTTDSSTVSTWSSYCSSTINTVQKEDVGDMLRSNYIILRDRNYPNENGSIVKYTTAHPEYSHRIKHDLNEVTNLSIIYKNMYF